MGVRHVMDNRKYRAQSPSLPMIWMESAKSDSRRFVGPNGDIVSEWKIYLGLRSGRIDYAERATDGYRLDGVWYSPVGQT